MTTKREKQLIDKIRATDKALDNLIMQLPNTVDSYNFLQINYYDREITAYKNSEIIDFLYKSMVEKFGMERHILKAISEKVNHPYLSREHADDKITVCIDKDDELDRILEMGDD